MGRALYALPLDIDGIFRAPTEDELAEEVTNARKTPPEGYPSDRSQYADPEHLKYPIDEQHIHAALSYYNKGGQREKGGYSTSEWASIGRRIARAANKLIGPGHAFVNGKIATPSNKDPDHDGDNDSKGGKADTDHDASEEQTTPRGYPSDDALPTAQTTIVAEDITVNGVQCFRYEAMLIPGDAVSRNTVPGKRGPTYYAARRVRQYVDDNNALIEELNARDQRVTVYPRHAAALSEATLPLGWVEGYQTRPSADRAGLEDAWYTACIPLTTEGADVLARMRTGLVKFSSLRSLDTADAFQTTPVKVNGKVVEEATRLLIGGVDLVATQPGLPVKPIRLLEEAARIEAYEPPAPPVATPPTTSATVPTAVSTPAPTEEHHHMGKRAVPAKFHACPQCAADISAHVGAAYEEMAANDDDADDGNGVNPKSDTHGKLTTKGHSHGKFGQHSHSNDADHSDAPMAEEVAALQAKLTEETTRRQAIEAELTALRGQQEASPAVAELTAKVQALEAEIKTFDGLKATQAKIEAREALEAKIDELVAEDTTRGEQMRPIIEAAVTEETKPEEVAVLYWKLRSDNIEKLVAARHARLTGRGFVHFNEAVGRRTTEELRTAANEETPPPASGASDEPMSETKAAVLRMFGK